jgi:hypothetical protein
MHTLTHTRFITQRAHLLRVDRAERAQLVLVGEQSRGQRQRVVCEFEQFGRRLKEGNRGKGENGAM